MSKKMDIVSRLRAWTHGRLGLGRGDLEPARALEDVVAVYSSHPTCPVALLSRCRSLDSRDFETLETEPQAIRLPAMRQSIFLVPIATAPRIFAATRQPFKKLARKLRYAGLDRDRYEKLKEPVLEHASEPIGGSELKQALLSSVDGLEDIRILTAVRIMAYEGLVLRLSTSLRTDSLQYVATESWLGHPLDDPDPDESVRWLARTYLERYGPARHQDFAWWSGLTKTRSGKALEGVETVELKDDLLLPADLEESFRQVEPVHPDALSVVPKWDPYTMGHAPDGRQRLVEDRHLESAYTTSGSKSGATTGDGLPLILRGGRAVASWSHRFDGDAMDVEATPFEGEELSAEPLEEPFERVGELLDASEVRVSVSS